MEHLIICIGRQYGSGGREIGERLAQKLGVSCYDKLLVKKAAEKSGLSEDYIRQAEETPANTRWFISGNVFADTAGIGEAFYSHSEVVYKAERSAIEQIAAKESCVIIGRSASSILRSQNCLSVFIYASEADKVARVAARNGMSGKEAAERIRKVDRMRQRYFDEYSQTKWGQPESYDLLLSSSRFGIETCVDLILSAAGAKKEDALYE